MPWSAWSTASASWSPTSPVSVGGSLLRAHGGCVVINVHGRTLRAAGLPRAQTVPEERASWKSRATIRSPFSPPRRLKPEPMAIDTRGRADRTGGGVPGPVLRRRGVSRDLQGALPTSASRPIDDEGAAAQLRGAGGAHRAATEELPPFAAGAVAGCCGFGARSVDDRRKLPSQWRRGGRHDARGRLLGRAKTTAATASAPKTCSRRWTQRMFRSQPRRGQDPRAHPRRRDPGGHRRPPPRAGQRAGRAGHRRLRLRPPVAHHRLRAPWARTAWWRSTGRRKMSGRTYDKGGLHPLPATCATSTRRASRSACRRASRSSSRYAEIEGDSASAAELLRLDLEPDRRLPLRQDLAVTG